MLKIIEGRKFLENGADTYLPRSAIQLDSIKTDVKNYIEDVKTNGDLAIIKYTEKFDKILLKENEIKVTSDEIKNAYNFVSQDLVTALKGAIANIKKFHEAQLKNSWEIVTSKGVKVGQIYRPIESVGLYIPGGRAAYPSTVIMTAIPAQVAGVENIILCSPPNILDVNGKKYNGIVPSVLVAANECGIKNIYKAGSAWGIAAMAYGTKTIPKVQKIVGPGNKYVNAAKLIVKDFVSIDNPAGPSEIGIISDDDANPEYIAYDLISQVEHDPDNVGVLISSSQKIIEETLQHLEKITKTANRKEIILESLRKYGLAIKTKDLEESILVSNEFGPEHLEILTKDPKLVMTKIKNAGAIFLGENSPVPLGDYCAGSNHVLPTGGSSKRFSGLSTFEFIKVIDYIDCSKEGLANLEKILTPIAEFEGLPGHSDAVKIRLKANNNRKKTG
jgi:histidinol dehydrogenase